MANRLERRILLKHITGCSDADLIIQPDPDLTTAQQSAFDEGLARLALGEPVSKIIGQREFYSLAMRVSHDVLDPRPDSETLVDAVLSYIKGRESVRILELGCGSGCLSIAIAANHPGCTIDCVDVSHDALAIAHLNVEAHGLHDRIHLAPSDWYQSVEGVYDIILSNPPYIESQVIPLLADGVKNYDPILSLDGGEDGLTAYREIFSQAKKFLYPQGALFLEHGIGQEADLQRLIEPWGFAQIRSFPDLAGTNRVFAVFL